MSYYWAGEAYTLWKRIYDERVLTDDGIYAEGEVPTDYAGPELTIQYNHMLIYVNTAGQFKELKMFDYKDVLDKDNENYEGVKYEILGKELRAGGGNDPENPLTKYIEAKEETPEDFDQDVASKAEILYGAYLDEITEEEE